MINMNLKSFKFFLMLVFSIFLLQQAHSAVARSPSSGGSDAYYQAAFGDFDFTGQHVLVRVQRVFTEDGVGIFVRQFLPQSPAKATVIVIHGIGENGGRYKYIVEELVAKNYNVIVPDLRGHGLSGGERAYVENFEDFVKDVHAVVRDVETKNIGQDLYILGHSMGGLVTYLYATSERLSPAIKKVVLASPALSVKLDWSKSIKLWVSPLLPKRMHLVSKFHPEFLVNTPEEIARAQKNISKNGFMTVNLGAELIRASQSTLTRAAKWKLPLLVLESDSDNLIDNTGNAHVLAAIPPSIPRQIKIISGTKHEVLNAAPAIRAQIFFTIEKFFDRL